MAMMSTWIAQGWSKGEGRGFENCDASNQYIQFEKYEITLDGNSLGVKDYVEDEYSAVVKEDPCLHHVVRIKLKVGNAYHGQEKWQTTNATHHHKISEAKSLFSNLLKEGIKRLCKVVGKLQQRPLPDDVREKCIKNIVHDKGKGFVFLNMINPSGKQENHTVCVPLYSLFTWFVQKI